MEDYGELIDVTSLVYKMANNTMKANDNWIEKVIRWSKKYKVFENLK